ncbi:DUF6520 family protein [Chryseobacterium sp.]|uniref:DUF6520 family protein n=1 Tax=Chryseobacterium sp. TaxID=1871047 RepID=UPI0033402712
MKKILLPAFIVAMGVGAAFATNKVSKSSKVIPTFRIDAVTNQCEDVQVECNELGSFLCKWDAGDGSQLYRMPDEETICADALTRSTP